MDFDTIDVTRLVVPGRNVLAVDAFNPARVREDLLATRRVCEKHNCPLEIILKKVGVEPTGEAFNSIVLDEDSNRPFNPLVNAGAIATAWDAVRPEPRYSREGAFEQAL